MTIFALSKALESGLIYGILALGVFVSYRVMKIPDLTVDGSFTTGAAVSAVFTLNGQPILGIFFAILAGMLAGSITATLHTKFKIAPVLAGILVMTALYSINLRIMNNQATITLIRNKTVFSFFEPLAKNQFGNLVFPLAITTIFVLILMYFFSTHMGLAVRATGDNEIMVRSSSINTNLTKTLALAIANGLAALSGGLIAQQQNYAEVNMGGGVIVLGLAALILGEALIFAKKNIKRNMIAAVVGAMVYRVLTAFVLQINMKPSDLKLLSAIVVTIAISIPILKEKLFKEKNKHKEETVHAKAS